LPATAEQVRKNRVPAAADNPFVAMQENLSRQIVAGLDAWRDATEALAERTFLTVYGSPTLQAAMGIDPASTRPLRRAARNPLHAELLRSRIAELKSRVAVGGLREAVIRGLIYVAMTRAGVDERGFEAVRRIRQTLHDFPLSTFKALVRDQFNILLVDEEAALAAIPSMLPADTETRRKAFGLIKQVLAARGKMSPQDNKRLGEIGRLFGLAEESAPARSLTVVASDRKEAKAQAS
jgi:hypothetical protein